MTILEHSELTFKPRSFQERFFSLAEAVHNCNIFPLGKLALMIYVLRKDWFSFYKRKGIKPQVRKSKNKEFPCFYLYGPCTSLHSLSGVETPW